MSLIQGENSSLIKQPKKFNPQQQIFADSCRKIVGSLTDIKAKITLHLESIRTIRDQLRLAESQAAVSYTTGSSDVGVTESASETGLVNAREYEVANDALIDAYLSVKIFQEESERLKTKGMMTKFPAKNLEIASRLFRKLGSLILMSNEPYRACRLYLLALTVHPDFTSSHSTSDNKQPSAEILTMWCLYFFCLIRGGLWKLASQHRSILESFEHSKLAEKEDSFEGKMLHSLSLWIRLHDSEISDKTSLVKSAVSLLKESVKSETKNFQNYRLQAVLFEIVSDACRLSSTQWTGVHHQQERGQQPNGQEKNLYDKFGLNCLGLLDESSYKWRTVFWSYSSTSGSTSQDLIVGPSIDFSSPKFSNCFEWSAMDTVSYLSILQRIGKYFMESGLCRDALGHFDEGFTMARRLAYPKWNYCLLACLQSLQSLQPSLHEENRAYYYDMKLSIYDDQAQVPSLDKERDALKDLQIHVCSSLNLIDGDQKVSDADLTDIINHPFFFGQIRSAELRTLNYALESLDKISFVYFLLEEQYTEFVESWWVQVRGIKSLKDLIRSVESIWAEYGHLLFYPLRTDYANLLSELYRKLILNEMMGSVDLKKEQHWKPPSASSPIIDIDDQSSSTFLTTSTTNCGDLEWSLWYYLNESLVVGLRQRAFIFRKELKSIPLSERFPFTHIQNPTALRRLINHYLPPDWTICHIHLTDLPPTLIRPVDGSTQPPSMKRLWICRYSKTNLIDRPLLCSKIISAAEEERVRRKIMEMHDRNESSMNERNKQRFWAARKAIDADIQELLKEIEGDWLGEWKYLLIPSSASAFTPPADNTSSPTTALPSLSDSFAQSLSKLEWTSFGISLLTNISHYFGSRLPNELSGNHEHLTNFIQQLIKMDWAFCPSAKEKKTRKGSNRSSSRRPADGHQPERSKKQEYVAERTKELLQIEFLSHQFTSILDISGKGTESNNPNSQRPHNLSTILILSNQLHEIGWESLPIHLVDNNQSLVSHGISRMMSVHFLIRSLELMRQQKENGADDCRRLLHADKTFYVLNPSNDLKQTQSTFEQSFRRQNGWEGLAGSPPSSSLIKSVLRQNHLLVYCGHGSGTRFIGSSAILETGVCRAVVLLMGCSSIRLKSYGGGSSALFEPRGVLHDYILANCPSIVGCLWGVTDRDIDKFLLNLLVQWLTPPCSFAAAVEPSFSSSSKSRQLSDKSDDRRLRELCRSIKSARAVTKLNYLTGAAPVSYGIPIFNSYSLQKL